MDKKNNNTPTVGQWLNEFSNIKENAYMSAEDMPDWYKNPDVQSAIGAALGIGTIAASILLGGPESLAPLKAAGTIGGVWMLIESLSDIPSFATGLVQACIQRLVETGLVPVRLATKLPAAIIGQIEKNKAKLKQDTTLKQDTPEIQK